MFDNAHLAFRKEQLYALARAGMRYRTVVLLFFIADVVERSSRRWWCGRRRLARLLGHVGGGRLCDLQTLEEWKWHRRSFLHEGNVNIKKCKHVAQVAFPNGVSILQPCCGDVRLVTIHEGACWGKYAFLHSRGEIRIIE